MTPSRMRAIRVVENGGPEVLSVDEVDVPTPGARDAIVRIEAAGVNFIDTYQRSGLYKIPLPATLGQEGAGVVVAIGNGVTEVAVGDRVAYHGVGGAYAEFAAVPAERLVPVPDNILMQHAAAVMLQGMTAHYLTMSTYPIRVGDICLVHAAAGGVGLLLCQIAAMRGARVIGTVSTAEKAALAIQAGAHDVINYTTHDFEAEVKRLTDGRGVQVVYDSVGRTTFDQSLRSLLPRGVLVSFGQSSGAVPPFDPLRLAAAGSVYLTRPTIGHYVATRDELLARARDLFDWLTQGKLHVRVEHTYPLEQAADAHRALEGRKTTGKILLLPS